MQNNSGDLEKLEELKDVLSWLKEKERSHAEKYEKRIKQIEKNPEEEEPKIKAKKHGEKALRLIGAEIQVVIVMMIFEMSLTKKALLKM